MEHHNIDKLKYRLRQDIIAAQCDGRFQDEGQLLREARALDNLTRKED